METILARRSIRKYTGEPVPAETVIELLKAAMSAPSAANQQPWHFVVITERELLDQVPSFHSASQMITQAPLAIAVCVDLTLVTRPDMWVQDCAAATQNLLLAAQDVGLGAVWLGVYPREERVAGLIRLLNLPDHVTPFALVPIGHPAESKPAADRFSEDRVHYNGW